MSYAKKAKVEPTSAVSLDRFSSLPPEIKVTILSKLNVSDAIRTSILSRAWRNVWTTSPKIILSDKYGISGSSGTTTRSKFITLVDLALLLHNGPLVSFSIRCLRFYYDVFDRWMYMLSRKKPRSITIKFLVGDYYKIPSSLFSISDLEYLHLKRCTIGMPQEFEGFKRLTVLNLKYFSSTDSDINNLISSCHLLNTLRLKYFEGITCLSIQAQALQDLEVKGNFQDFHLHAPNLSNVGVTLDKTEAQQSVVVEGNRKNYLKQAIVSLTSIVRLVMKRCIIALPQEFEGFKRLFVLNLKYFSHAAWWLKASVINLAGTRCHCTLGGSVHMCVKDILNIFSRVRLKDGYGFVVFDSNDDAARAMRALQGKFVCGERITVNWSKQQPRFSKDLRSSRNVESSHRRAPRDGNIRSRDSIAQKNHPASHDQGHSPDVAPEKISSDGALEKKSDDDVEDLKDVRETVGEDPVEMKRNEDGTSDANVIEHDRWEETGKGNPGRDDDDFDCYEPYHGYARQEEREEVVKASSQETNHHRFSSQKSKEDPGERFDTNHYKSKSPPSCYNRGAAGHTARDCPLKTDGRFEAWRDALSRQERLRRFGSPSRMRPDTRDCSKKTDDRFEAWRDALSRQEKGMVRLKRFGSPSRKRPEEFRVDMVVETHRMVQDGRKQFSDRTSHAHRLSNVSREDKKHTRCSDGIPQTPKESRKRSRSKRSRGSSLSSDRSTSHSTSKCSHSRAHSPSHSAHSSSKSFQPTQPKGLRSMAVSNVSPLLVSGSPQLNLPSSAENKNSNFLVNSPLEGNLDSKTTGLKHIRDYQQDIKDSRLSGEAPVIPLRLKIQRNGELTVSGKDANLDGYTETNLNKNLVYDDNVANGVQVQKTNSEDASSVKSNKDILVNNESSSSLKLTTNEVVSALKHYGIEARGTDLLNQPVEKYFGAARLWPWEVIYYRKLKKGPISTENYAKRLEQNKQYSIVDRYVRSSSGWWECH
uniref:RRM domain-containing protein n=1 Tax=Oryza punctata TaxID=4537 RepID=A0A0E0K0Q3_ORYPU